MSEAPGTFDQLGTALHAGDREVVMSCFAANARLSLRSIEGDVMLPASGVRDAIDALLTGFDDLRLTPTSRIVSKEQVVERAVLSGKHTGSFAGAEPTGRRVRVNVRLSATWAPDSTLETLQVEADTRALFAQIADTEDLIGMTGGLVAMVRERYDGPLHVTDETTLPPAATRASSKATRSSRSGRRWVVPVAVAATVLVAGLTWRSMSASGDPSATANADALRTATNAASTTRAATPSTQVPPPKASPQAPVRPSARPVIATANPKSAPKVQAGKQLVLKADVLFAFDSARLAPAAIATVTRLGQQVRTANVTGTIQINGYTDNQGSLDYDSALSRARALSVARILQSALVGRRVTLVPQGFGQVNPIASNASETGRARNRRVTIVLPVQH